MLGVEYTALYLLSVSKDKYFSFVSYSLLRVLVNGNSVGNVKIPFISQM